MTLRRDRDVVVAHDRLEQVLVHAQRRGGDAGADVGHAGQLEQPLHGAVLAERAMEDGEDHVHVGERGRDGAARRHR